MHEEYFESHVLQRLASKKYPYAHDEQKVGLQVVQFGYLLLHAGQVPLLTKYPIAHELQEKNEHNKQFINFVAQVLQRLASKKYPS